MMMTCTRCKTTSPRVMVNGIDTDPVGWCHLTISGQPMLNCILCARCAVLVHKLIKSGRA